MVDLHCTIKALRQAWQKRAFSSSKGTWKDYLTYILKDFGGLFFFYCDYRLLKIFHLPLGSTRNFYSGGLNSAKRLH